MFNRIVIASVLAIVGVSCVAARGSHEPLLGNWDFNITNQHGVNSIRVAMRGDIELTEDDRAVEWMSPGARLYIKETRGFTTTELMFEGAEDGTPRRSLWVNGVERDGRPSDRRIVSDFLQRAAEDFGVGGLAKMDRLHAANGIGGAISVVSHVKSSTAQAYLFAGFTERHDLTEDESVRFVEATDSIASSSTLRETIEALSRSLDRAEPVTVALLEAASHIASSSDTRDALIAVASDRRMTTSTGIAMARTVEGIPSSSDQRDALQVLSRYVDNDREAIRAYLSATETIASSSDARDCLISLLEVEIPPDNHRQFFEAVSSIASTSDKRDVLVESAGRLELTGDAVAFFLAAVMNVQSSSDQLDAIKALNVVAIPDQSMARLFAVVSQIPSSSDQRDALLDILQQQSLGAAAVIQFALTSESVKSSSDQTDVIRALIDYAGRDREMLSDDEEVRRAIADAIDSIKSNSDRSEVYAEFVRVFD